MLTFETISKDPKIREYIHQADQMLGAMGCTDHSFAHITQVSTKAGDILSQLGYPARYVEMTRIAGFLHDIGNIVNRVGHAQSGAIMAFRILDNMGCDPAETAQIVSAIGNHDESTAYPVNAMAAALILADKSDVRRSRVRNRDKSTFDIHDRVNYAVTESTADLSEDKKSIRLALSIDTEMCSVAEYFQIFMGRMQLCRQAAAKLGLEFELWINGQKLM